MSTDDSIPPNLTDDERTRYCGCAYETVRAAQVGCNEHDEDLRTISDLRAEVARLEARAVLDLPGMTPGHGYDRSDIVDAERKKHRDLEQEMYDAAKVLKARAEKAEAEVAAIRTALRGHPDSDLVALAEATMRDSDAREKAEAERDAAVAACAALKESALLAVWALHSAAVGELSFTDAKRRGDLLHGDIIKTDAGRAFAEEHARLREDRDAARAHAEKCDRDREELENPAADARRALIAGIGLAMDCQQRWSRSHEGIVERMQAAVDGLRMFADPILEKDEDGRWRAEVKKREADNARLKARVERLTAAVARAQHKCPMDCTSESYCGVCQILVAALADDEVGT